MNGISRRRDHENFIAFTVFIYVVNIIHIWKLELIYSQDHKFDSSRPDLIIQMDLSSNYSINEMLIIFMLRIWLTFTSIKAAFLYLQGGKLFRVLQFEFQFFKHLEFQNDRSRCYSTKKDAAFTAENQDIVAFSGTKCKKIIDGSMVVRYRWLLANRLYIEERYRRVFHSRELLSTRGFIVTGTANRRSNMQPGTPRKLTSTSSDLV